MRSVPKPVQSKIHLGMAVLWLGLLVPTIVWWKDSILYVGLISVYAIILEHLTAYLAGKSDKGAEDDQTSSRG